MKSHLLLVAGTLLLLTVLGLTYQPRRCAAPNALPWLQCHIAADAK
jgi:hypothetical protein